MTQDRIIELAREAGMEWQGGFSRVVECATQPELERFAALVRAHALEEAAKVCDARATKNELACHDADEDEATSLRSAAWQISVCASAIRAMKEQT